MTAVKIAVLTWFQDKLTGFAMSRPWSPKLSSAVDKIQVQLDALREGGGR